MDVISAKLVENACIKNPDLYPVDSQVKSDQDIEAIFHDSKPQFAHGIAAVLQVAFEQVYLTEMEDWVIRRKQLKWNLGLWRCHDFKMVCAGILLEVELQVGFVFDGL